jgi:uncharacterized protein YutE (UPF0331/DUF86 family)
LTRSRAAGENICNRAAESVAYRGVKEITRRFNELKRTALSMMSQDNAKLNEKVIDSMIDIVREREELEKKRKRKAIERRVQNMIEKAEKDAHRRYSAKVDTLEVIKIHIKKGEFEEAGTLLRGFYLTRKLRRRRAPKAEEKAPEPEVSETVREALEAEAPKDVFSELADLMSISEEEARMYSLELAEGFRKATRHEMNAEKAAECYLKFRNWDFKNTWFSAISRKRG